MQAAAKVTLSNLVEEHITSLVREAACVQRHAKRGRFHQQQPSSNVGGDGQQPVLRRRLHADDVNLALQWRGSERLYTTNAGNLPLPVVGGDGSGGSTATVDRSSQRIDLNSYVRSEMTSVRPPSEIGMAVHWLAVDGIQPAIPQNPLVDDRRVMGGGAAADRVVHRVEDEEDLNDVVGAEGGTGGELMAPDGTPATLAGGVSVRQLLPRLLSEELQLYFTRVTLAIERGSPIQADAAIASVSRDAGTQELVPFFARFVSRQIYDNVGQAEYCRTLVRLADALISNPHLHLELHLHQMLPAIITCVVASSLAARVLDDHWALREDAARTLVKACHIFGGQYTTLKPRLIRTLCEAMGPNKPLTTQYGAIFGVSLFGPKAVDAFILPLATLYWERWEAILDTETEEERRFDVQQCQSVLLNALSVFLCGASLGEQAKRLNAESFVDVFGEKIIPLQASQSEYLLCVL